MQTLASKMKTMWEIVQKIEKRFLRCNYCGSRQELSSEYLVYTCKNRHRYSRERGSQSLEVIQFIFSVHSSGPSSSAAAPPAATPAEADQAAGGPPERKDALPAWVDARARNDSRSGFASPNYAVKLISQLGLMDFAAVDDFFVKCMNFR